MMRLMGFLIGSSLVLGLWWTLGSPMPVEKLHRPKFVPRDESAAPVSLPESPIGPVSESVARQTPPEAPPAAISTELAGRPGEIVTRETQIEAPSLPDIPAQPIWSPFRNGRAAQGFADRLTQLSGETFTVRRAGLFDYRVEFPYTDPDRRDTVLADLETRTGLKLVGGQP